MADPRTSLSAFKRYVFALLCTARQIFLTRHKAVRIIPLAFCLSLPLSTGPQVQEYIVSALNTDANSIYGSLYQESPAKFPSLKTWLIGGLHWVYVVMGLAIALLSACPRQPKPLFQSISISSFFVLMVVDIARRFIDLSFQFVFINVFANLAGGLGVGLLVVTAYILLEAGFRLMATSQTWQTPAIFVLLPLTGILTSTVIYYAADLIYRPLSLPLTVQLKKQGAGPYYANAPGPKQTHTSKT